MSYLEIEMDTTGTDAKTLQIAEFNGTCYCIVFNFQDTNGLGASLRIYGAIVGTRCEVKEYLANKEFPTCGRLLVATNQNVTPGFYIVWDGNYTHLSNIHDEIDTFSFNCTEDIDVNTWS